MSASIGSSRWPLPPELRNHYAERRALGQLVAAVRVGHSHALVIHGVQGVGKSALLEYLADHTRRLPSGPYDRGRVRDGIPVRGSPSVVCAHVDRAERIPEPQRDALRTAFGLLSAPPRTDFSSPSPYLACFLKLPYSNC